MFLEKITWKQAEGYFKEKDIAIIPLAPAPPIQHLPPP